MFGLNYHIKILRMKKGLFLIISLFVSVFAKTQIKIEILKINEPLSTITLHIINDTDEVIVLYDNFLYSLYDIYNSKGDEIIAMNSYTKNNHDFNNYQNNFTKKKINQTKKKYNLSYENAIYFLENIRTSILIAPYTKKEITLKVFNAPENPTSTIEYSSYYLVGKVFLNIEFLPKIYINCLQKKGYKILKGFNIPKTNIDISHYFLHEVRKIAIPEHLKNKFKYDEKGNIVPIK